mmetsp:Transcript_13113/g.20437  ORF Transcript_13113/g.20437 Transcript_13113/m.20437 type:complete len:365 (+) Transcript_13113:141-1235(+)
MFGQHFRRNTHHTRCCLGGIVGRHIPCGSRGCRRQIGFVRGRPIMTGGLRRRGNHLGRCDGGIALGGSRQLLSLLVERGGQHHLFTFVGIFGFLKTGFHGNHTGFFLFDFHFQFGNAFFQFINFILFGTQGLVIFNTRLIFVRLGRQHGPQGHHFLFQFFILTLEFADILLFLLQFIVNGQGMFHPQRTLKCQDGGLEFAEDISWFNVPDKGLDANGGQCTACGISTPQGLIQDHPLAQSLKSTTQYLHSEMFHQQMSCDILTEGHPSLTSLHTTVHTLNGHGGMTDNQIPFALFQSTHPTLNECGSRTLMKDTMSFQSIVRGLAHKDFGETQLNIDFGKGNGIRLQLHTSNLFGTGNALFVGF